MSSLRSPRSLLVLAAVLAAALACAAPASADRGYPQRLSAPGTRIVDEGGRTVLLRGFNIVPVWRGAHPRTWPAHHYAKIRAAGFNTVRFVLFWSDMEPRRGRLSVKRLRTLDTAIARARAARLYVVISAIHLWKRERHVPRWARTGDAITAVERDGRRYLRAIARRYRNEPAVAAYDPVNEPPTVPIDQHRVMRLYERVIRVIRRVDRRKLIIVQPSFGDSSLAPRYADLGLFARHRGLVLSIHDYYAGGGGDGYRWLDGGLRGIFTYNAGVGYRVSRRSDLERHLMVSVGAARRAGVPLWIGEFGITHDAPGALAFTAEKAELFRRYGLGYAWWLYGCGQGPFDAADRDCRFRELVSLVR